MGPGSCVVSERGLIKHEQVIGFHILIPVFKPFLSSSRVSAWGSSHLRFDVEQLKGPPPGPSPPPGEAGVPGRALSQALGSQPILCGQALKSARIYGPRRRINTAF